MLGRVISELVFPVPKPPSYSANSLNGELIWIPQHGCDVPRSCRRETERHAGQEQGVDGLPKISAAEAETAIPCLLRQHESAQYAMVYFHCNGEDLGGCREFCNFLSDQFKVHVLAVEYPGYGLCPGTPSVKGIKQNAQSVMEYARNILHWPSAKTIIVGRSIGTGPACTVAASYDVAGLILVAPFSSIRNLIRDRIGSLAGLLSLDDFQNSEEAAKLECPVFIVHGTGDTVIPFDHGRLIYSLIRSKKIMVMPQAVEHSSRKLFTLDHFTLPLLMFISRLKGGDDTLPVLGSRVGAQAGYSKQAKTQALMAIGSEDSNKAASTPALPAAARAPAPSDEDSAGRGAAALANGLSGMDASAGFGGEDIREICEAGAMPLLRDEMAFSDTLKPRSDCNAFSCGFRQQPGCSVAIVSNFDSPDGDPATPEQCNFKCDSVPRPLACGPRWSATC
eukprot:TRINITY_DN74752_c0_g1_i1.p1 TRINITY_DN74752_c0_g1~~TRINITY_DN74752_c0_g1_i1.p1  ORF type:complete len:450 (+),score=66.42 TRINITY_DN74752_c0_g1_i1:107-1456(+)